MDDDDIPVEVRRLLDAVKADENPAAERARAQLKVSVARMTRPRPWRLRAPVAILIGLGSVAAIGLLRYQDSIPRAAPVSTSVATSISTSPPPPPPLGPPSVEVPSFSVDALPAASNEVRPPSRTPEIGPQNELKLLHDANAALEAGDARLAMRRCSEYRKQFPSGRFVTEIDAIEIRAYAAAGRCAEARSLGERFFDRHSDSPYARRIHSALASACP